MIPLHGEKGVELPVLWSNRKQFPTGVFPDSALPLWTFQWKSGAHAWQVDTITVNIEQHLIVINCAACKGRWWDVLPISVCCWRLELKLRTTADFWMFETSYQSCCGLHHLHERWDGTKYLCLSICLHHHYHHLAKMTLCFHTLVSFVNHKFLTYLSGQSWRWHRPRLQVRRGRGTHLLLQSPLVGRCWLSEHQWQQKTWDIYHKASLTEPRFLYVIWIKKTEALG